MALKYALGTATELQEIADALDKQNGLLDPTGTTRTPIPARIVIGGVDVTGDPRFDPNARAGEVVVGTFSAVGAITTDPADPDGTACLALDDESPAVAPYLGLTIYRVPIPAAGDLVLPENLPPNLAAILHPPPAPLPGGPPADDPPEASATLQVDVQMRDDDHDGELEPHLEVHVEEGAPGTVAGRMLAKMRGKHKAKGRDKK